MTELPAVFTQLLEDSKKAMLDEYEHGFEDAIKSVSVAFDSTLTKSKTLPGAEAYLPGLELAVEIINECKTNMLAAIRKQSQALGTPDAKD